jgi:leucyl-tRNA synthetase
VDPEHLIVTYGADTARMFSLFAAPPEKDLEWSDAGVEGASRFLGRVWRLVQDLRPRFAVSTPPVRITVAGATVVSTDIEAGIRAQHLRRLTHKTIKKVTEDIEREFQFNTAIAALMEFVNGLYKYAANTDDLKRQEAIDALREAIEALLLLLTPFAPHIAEELWEATGHATSLAQQRWPAYDAALIQEEVLTIPVQVNGKVRARIEIGAEWSEVEIRAASVTAACQGGWVKDAGSIANFVYVPKRIVNIVVK